MTINKLQNEVSRKHLKFDDNSTQIKETKVKKIREYCDHCEVFDVHDTKNCSKEIAQREELRNHVASFSSFSKLNSSKASRPFCNYCEAFVHQTNECPNRI